MAKQTTERVHIRSKKLKTGMESWYLQVYRGRKADGTLDQPKKFLGIKTYTDPKGAVEIEHNKKMKVVMEQMLLEERMKYLKSEGFVFGDEKEDVVDFGRWLDEYVEKYAMADIRVIQFVVADFKKFMRTKVGGDVILTDAVTEKVCEEFAEHLMQTHKGSGAQTYFQRLHKAIKRAKREGVLTSDPCAEIKVKKDKGTELKKETLNDEEKQMLIDCQPDTINKDVRCGFLFTLECGCAYCDLLNITWGNITDEVVDGVECRYFSYKRNKTSEVGGSIIPAYLLAMMGERGRDKDKVFPNLPKTNEGGNKTLRQWAEIAGITKHITWYSGRHTCATLDISAGKDPNGVAHKMGHKTTFQTLTTYSHKSKQAALRMDVDKVVETDQIQTSAPQQGKEDGVKELIAKVMKMKWLTPEQKLKMIEELTK